MCDAEGLHSQEPPGYSKVCKMLYSILLPKRTISSVNYRTKRTELALSPKNQNLNLRKLIHIFRTDARWPTPS